MHIYAKICHEIIERGLDDEAGEELGWRTFLDTAKNKNTCPRCGDVLHDRVALKKHREKGFCWLKQQTKKQQRKNRRYTRLVEKRARDIQEDVEEKISITTLDRKTLPRTQTFKYLGTHIDPTRGMGPELRYRV